MRNRFSIAILFCITTTATVFGQVSEAEDKVAELLLSEADFPKRYAVHCDYEYSAIEEHGQVIYRSSQYLAVDQKTHCRRLIANQQTFLDFEPIEQVELDIWIDGNRVEWFYNSIDDVWKMHPGNLFSFFDPKNVVVGHPDFIGETFFHNTISEFLEGRDCVKAENKDGFLVSKWSLKEAGKEEVNRITVLKHRIGKPGPPDEILSMRSIRGGWSWEKDGDFNPRRRIIEWCQVSDTVWVPKKIRIISRLSGRDREATFVMKWAFGDAVPERLFIDPRNQRPQNDLLKLKFEQCPTITP